MLLGELLEEGADHVAIDNEKAAREATEHLIGIGRRNILAVGGVEAPGLGTAEARTRGYLAALAEAGISHRPEALLPVDDFRMPDGARAVAAPCAPGSDPTHCCASTTSWPSARCAPCTNQASASPRTWR